MSESIETLRPVWKFAAAPSANAASDYKQCWRPRRKLSSLQATEVLATVCGDAVRIRNLRGCEE